MDTLYTTIKQFLDIFFPTAIQSTWGNLNELIAIIITYMLLYKFVAEPLFSLLSKFAPKKKL